MSEWTLGVIGGSGLYEIPGLTGEWRSIESQWGTPSDAVFDGMLDGQRIVFLPRHGRGHRLPPSHVNYRANIDALKRAGCTDLLSLSACGSLKQELPPGTFVVVDQYIDRTIHRESSFFGPGLVAHVSMAHPTCPRLSQMAWTAAKAAGATVVLGGTYLAMEGPQFSSLAESKLYRSWGCDVIGMTNMPEAKLAREAELPYTSIGMVTDYDCWHEEVDAVTVTNVLAVMHANAAKARETVAHLARAMAQLPRVPSPIDTVLDVSVLTPKDAWDAGLKAKIAALSRFG
jgi:5'-methylthioadenosine phosphorylase